MANFAVRYKKIEAAYFKALNKLISDMNDELDDLENAAGYYLGETLHDEDASVEFTSMARDYSESDNEGKMWALNMAIHEFKDM